VIPITFAGQRALRILAIGAHADDIEIGAGGMLEHMLAAGRVAEVDWVVVSATDDRADEARASARTLIGDRATLRVEISAFRERYLPYDPEVKGYIDSLGARMQPDVILSPRLEDRHQDHRILAELTWQAFRDHLILEYEVPKYEGDLGSPNVYVPLSEPEATAKVRHLMAAFTSQRHRPWFDEAAFRAVLRLRGIESNSPSGWAEAFTARKVSLTL
jgi:LmbE family N-acetylglucosaminyl deacetylase